ncbi:MICOS complex subunit Mic10-like [Acanthaster planci]|uniref:MICOS complex subunit MIC10 n=1 Tax=Acanthaster planci TaxID=133434 RepID=A0A8B7ZEV7_ACAPL|nr:MICOS complex subunit Mic10-like [Acanthaster planci]
MVIRKMAESTTTESENVLGRKWDQCVSDTLLKVGGGLGLGVIFSVFLFKRKLWPIHMGGGIGLGMGIANCNHLFKDPYNVQGTIVKVLKDKPQEPSASPETNTTTVITTEEAPKS